MSAGTSAVVEVLAELEESDIDGRDGNCGIGGGVAKRPRSSLAKEKPDELGVLDETGTQLEAAS